MGAKRGGESSQVRSLGIEQWHQLGLEGSMLPVTIALQGDSMRPLIRRGRDKVTIVPLMRPLRLGDVVLFRGGPERFVVHRVYRLRDSCVQTLGDNCRCCDPWMPLEQVWGLVVRVERDGRSYRLDNRRARIFGRCWMALFPLRSFYYMLRALAGRCYRRMFPRVVKGGDVAGE